jgi:hypothetical protein
VECGHVVTRKSAQNGTLTRQGRRLHPAAGRAARAGKAYPSARGRCGSTGTRHSARAGLAGITVLAAVTLGLAELQEWDHVDRAVTRPALSLARSQMATAIRLSQGNVVGSNIPGNHGRLAAYVAMRGRMTYAQMTLSLPQRRATGM